MTALLWARGDALVRLPPARRDPRIYFFMLGLAETGALGAFLAQDLLLFVLFFDLMLVPFYFLIGAWGGENRIAATTKMIVYTLVGSLLMLVGAIATAILAADQVGELSFSIADLRANPSRRGEPGLDLLVLRRGLPGQDARLPRPRLDAGRLPGRAARRCSRCSPACSRRSARTASCASCCRSIPTRRSQFQEVVLVIALASILYGSVMAFTQTNVRLIAGFSSVAQLGFITLGIFSLRPDGADGAVLQMVNHGLVVAPVFLIAALLAERAGTEDLRKMGGMATRAPMLAALFLIVTLALLAMPGSANFIGEFFILNGVFQAKIAMRLRRRDRDRARRLLRDPPLPAHDARAPARGRRVARDLAARGARGRAAGRSASSRWRCTRA